MKLGHFESSKKESGTLSLILIFSYISACTILIFSLSNSLRIFGSHLCHAFLYLVSLCWKLRVDDFISIAFCAVVFLYYYFLQGLTYKHAFLQKN